MRYQIIKSNPSWMVDSEGHFTGYAGDSILAFHRSLNAAWENVHKLSKHTRVNGIWDTVDNCWVED